VNGLKQDDDLSPLPSICASEYATRRPRKQRQTEVKRTHLCIFYVGDVNLLGENINIIKKNTALSDVIKKVVPEVNTEKNISIVTCSCLIMRLQNNDSRKVANKAFKKCDKI
jgi:hypothetical protein